MQLELKLKDILPFLVSVHREYVQTSESFKNQLGKYKERNERYQTAIRELGWREKCLNGFLGGNKAQVKSLEKEFIELSNFRKSLVKLDEKIKSIEESFTSEIIRFLSKESPEYIFNELNLQNHIAMANTSADFYNSLVEAKQKISDALMFTSWSGLVNHSKASVLLQEFYDQVEAFNQKVKQYQVEVKCNLLEVDLPETIDLATQQSAIHSLNELLNKSRKVLDYANQEINTLNMARKRMIDQMKLLVRQNKN